MSPPFCQAAVQRLADRLEAVEDTEGGEVEGQAAPLPHRLPQRQHRIQYHAAGGVAPRRVAAAGALLHLPQRAQLLLGLH